MFELPPHSTISSTWTSPIYWGSLRTNQDSKWHLRVHFNQTIWLIKIWPKRILTHWLTNHQTQSWDKNSKLYFSYVIPESLEFSHWLSEFDIKKNESLYMLYHIYSISIIQNINWLYNCHQEFKKNGFSISMTKTFRKQPFLKHPVFQSTRWSLW